MFNITETETFSEAPHWVLKCIPLMLTTNLFSNCYRFALLKKCSYLMEFLMVFWQYFFRNCLQLIYFQDKYLVFLFLRCPFSLIKLLIDCGLNVSLIAAWTNSPGAFFFLLYVKKRSGTGAIWLKALISYAISQRINIFTGS